MITALELRHFKGWSETGPIRLAPLTAFLGSNSSGKTSLLQSLLMMRQTTDSADRNRVLDLSGPTTIVELGTYQDILHRHDESEPIRMRVDWVEDEPYTVRDPLKQVRKVSSTLISSERFALEVEIAVSASEATVQEVVYKLGDASFALRRKKGREYDLTSDDFDFKRTTGRAWPLPPPSKFYGFPDQVRAYYQNAQFLSDLELKFEEACSRIKYLGPLREDPRRQYIYSGGAPGDVGRRGELAIDALIASRFSKTRVSRGWSGGTRRRRLPGIGLEELIAEWLVELGLIHSFELESLDDRETLYRVRVRRTAESVPVLLTDVGFGVSQVLPVLVLLAYANSGDTVVLEQPEIHLHPAVQAGLADILIETALARRVQVVLETHSEHLMIRLQRRLAEQTLGRGILLEADDVELYFCEQRGGASRLKRLDLDLFGNIRNWPEDFFGNPMADSVAMMEAAAARRGEQ